MRSGWFAVAAGLLLAPQFAAPQGQPSAKEAYGYKFLYADKVAPKEYLQSHPCVSGGWRFVEETPTHWVGELHYPTGNVPPAYPNGNEAAFVVKPVRVEKTKELPVDLKTWKGQVILLQPDTAVRFASQKSLEGAFRVIAVEAEKGKGETFLFKKRDELKYVKK
jgi:hypothetical protein